MADRYDATTAALPASALKPTMGRVLSVPSCRLVCREGPDHGREWIVDLPVVRIGRASHAEVALSDTTVSRIHAVCKQTPQGWTVSDAGSRHGVIVDDVRIETAYVGARSQIRIGATVLEFSPSLAEFPTVISRESELHGIIGASPAMRELFGTVRKLAPLAVTALITGPTGSGKGALARALHRASPRAAHPFVVLDCGNLDPALMRAELFGHEKGAFTGADAARPGVFEAAEKGTVFIDEIGELPLELQPRLLRVLEEREVQRLGAARAVPVDVRIVAATHRDLRGMVSRGQFREDLYFRLCVVELAVPPLCERPQDVPALAAHFLTQLAAAHRVPLGAEVEELLKAQPWPGNVRELRNALERALVLAGDDRLAPAHFVARPPRAPLAPDAAPPGKVEAPGDLEAAERLVIEAAYKRHQGHRNKIAAELGIALTTLRRKLRRYGFDEP